MLRVVKLALGWITGPLTSIGKVYVKGRNDAKLAEIEREVQKDFMHNALKEAALDDDFNRQEMVSAILRRDRGDHRTAWIRPVTAGMALTFWTALTLSQIELGGNGLLPIIWNVPPGALGKAFLAFPMGVLASFYISRPIEKFLIGRKR